MNKKQLWMILGMFAVGLVLAILILSLERPVVGEAEGESEHEQPAENVGSHGGQLLTNGPITLEILLSEKSGEPHFQIYRYENDRLLPPQVGELTMTLHRPDGESQTIGFEAHQDFLQSQQVIEEPHVFDASITVRSGKGTAQFDFAKDEGKIVLTDQQIEEAGIKLQVAGPARIQKRITLPGEIRFNEDRTSHVVPRVAGIAEEIPANLGQHVKKGDLLAVIGSASLSEQRSELFSAQKRLELAKSTFDREKHLWESKISAEQDYQQARQALSEAEIALHNAQQKLRVLGAKPDVHGELSRYEIRAPFEGIVVDKHISIGEAVKEDSSIFTISDLSSVWAEMIVSAKDLNVVRIGEPVTIKATALDSVASGTVSYVGALMGEQTRTAKARVTLANPQMAWRPGLFITVDMVASEADVPVAVAAEAVQSINNEPTVFVKIPGGFVAQPVETGLSDGRAVEIVKGLKPGTQVAVDDSFVLKSEQGKAGASHEH